MKIFNLTNFFWQIYNFFKINYKKIGIGEGNSQICPVPYGSILHQVQNQSFPTNFSPTGKLTFLYLGRFFSHPLSLFFFQEAIFRVVAAILHIGNIEFTKGKEIDSSVPKDDQAKFHLKTTAELLMYGFCLHYFVLLTIQFIFLCYGDSIWTSLYLRCDAAALEDALCKRVMVTPEEVIKRSLDPASAAISRDGLAKTVYSRLFDWWDLSSNVFPIIIRLQCRFSTFAYENL